MSGDTSGGKHEQGLSLDAEEFSSVFFRLYLFKVKRCPRGRPHDWTQCPYAHPGEKAKRRDPRRYQYSGTACPDFRKNGCCRRGDACPFAHGVFECWLHPQRYRTQLCADGTACKRRVCFFAHMESELRKPEEAAPQRVVNEDETRLSGAQLLQQQQLTQALTAILANGAAGSPGQNGFHHPTGPESRDEHSSSPVNPLAERAWQLQQQLQHLQTLQVMQSQQHAAAGSQRSSIDGRGSFDGGAGMAVPHMQAGNPRQALVQQQLQAQVDQEMLPMLGNGAAAGAPRHSSPFPPHQGSMEALALLQASQPTKLPLHSPANGLTAAGPLPRPAANGFGMREAYPGEVGRASHAELLAAGPGGLAGPRRMSLDSVMPPRPPPPLHHMRPGANGMQQWPSDGLAGPAVDPLVLAALQLSQRAMAMPPLSGRSSMDGPHHGEHHMMPPPAVSMPPQLAAPGFIDGMLFQPARIRGSLDLPPMGSRGLPPDQQAAAGHDFGWPAAGRPLPQRRSVDIGSVQRQGHPPLGGDFGMQLHPSHLLNAAVHMAVANGRVHSHSPGPVDGANPLLPVTAAMAVHEHLVMPSAEPPGCAEPAQGGQVSAGTHPPVSHGGHVVGLTQHRLATVGESEVSQLDVSAGSELLLQGLDSLDSKAFGEPSSASAAGNPSITRIASFDSILADLPRSLSEVHLQHHGPLSPSMDGPVKLDG